MNNLETQFLFKIDFSLRVLPEVFEKYNAELLLHSTAMGLERIAHSSDEDLLRVPQVLAAASDGVCHQREAVEAAPQAPLLQTYSNSELDYPPFVYPTPVPVQEESVASHYPIDVLQQQQEGIALDPVHPFQALASQV